MSFIVSRIKPEGAEALYFQGWPFQAFCAYLYKHAPGFSPIHKGQHVSYSEGNKVYFFEAINPETQKTLRAWGSEA